VVTVSEYELPNGESVEVHSPDYANPRFLIHRERPIKHDIMYDWCITVQTPDGIIEFPKELGQHVDAAFAESHRERSADIVTWELGQEADGYGVRKLSRFVDRLDQDDRLRIVRIRDYELDHKDYTVEIEIVNTAGACR
jgi:hypothetical protein